jgi:hypothetical protein
MNHEAPPSIAIDIQSWVRFGSGQLANIAGTLDTANLAGDFKEARNGRSVVGDLGCCCCVHHLCAGSSAKCQPHGFRTAQYRYSCRGVCQCPAGLHVRSASSIQLTSPPENGKVTVKKAKVSATNYKQCLALEVPAFVAFYRSRADFVGVDVLTLEVRSPDGTTQVQRISVTVGTGSPRAAHLNGRIKWSWCPRVDKPIARNHVRRIRRRDRPRIAFWNPSCF